MDLAITEALGHFSRYRSEATKIDNEILQTVITTRLKITETRALIAKADHLLDDFRKVWAGQ